MPDNEGGSPRLLVTDAVPLNGGDEALLQAFLASLRRRWPRADLRVLCTAGVERARTLNRLAAFPGLSQAFTDEGAVGVHYRWADVVISTPGGFLSDHYDITHRLRGFELALGAGKPLVLFAQSIGPFWRDETRVAASRVLPAATLLVTRDRASLEPLAAIGVLPERIRVSADAAFLWRGLAPELYVAKRGQDVARVALAFRRWPARDRTAFRQTVAKARGLVRALNAHGAREFVFVSTCQGLAEYTDDSELATRVVAGLAPELQAACTIDATRHDPRGLMAILGRCNLFVGMRLHGCVLAMLAGTPALGLAYEPKTPAVFSQMGLGACQVPFTTFQGTWLRKLEDVITRLDDIHERLPVALDRQRAKAERALDDLDEVIRGAATRRS